MWGGDWHLSLAIGQILGRWRWDALAQHAASRLSAGAGDGGGASSRFYWLSLKPRPPVEDRHVTRRLGPPGAGDASGQDGGGAGGGQSE